MAFTFFFRDHDVLELAVEHLLPEIAGRNRPLIWDAGCATGQEPYTLAIILAERMGPFAYKNMRIIASDLDDTDTFGALVTNAIYPKQEVNRIPEEIRNRYFVPADLPDNLKLVDLVRERVNFKKHNLLTLQPLGDYLSLIICKNVLLHFEQQQRIDVIKMYHASLAPRGLLIFEQTQTLAEELIPLFETVVPNRSIFRKRE